MEGRFFNDMANKVADIVVERNLRPTLELFEQHKRAKFNHDWHGIRAVECKECYMSVPASKKIQPCSTKDCRAMWCSRNELCQAETCSQCQRYICFACVQVPRKCHCCSVDVCDVCLRECAKCQRKQCQKCTPQKDLCMSCYIDQEMYEDHIYQIGYP